MKFRFLFILQMVAVAAFAAGPPLSDFCQPFGVGKAELVWTATNQLPSKVRIFRVIPTTFSPATISNALHLASLTPNNKMLAKREGVLAGKDVLSYGNREGTRHLDVIPSQGAIALSRRDAIALPKQPVVNVPNTEQAVKQLLGLLPKLGISRSEVVTNAQGQPVPYKMYEQKDYHFDKPTRTVITNIISRTIHLNRHIDGIPVWGAAGALAQFGNDGKIADLNITWRRIQPDGESAVPSSDQFLALLKSGASLIRKEQSMESYKRIIIRAVKLYYWEDEATEAQSHVYPFAVLEADTNAIGENGHIQLFIPLGAK